MAAPSSPTVRRWELGARLRKLRTDASLTIEDVAERMTTSSIKISRLETGDRPPQLRDVRDLCDLFCVSDDQRNQLMELARLGRERGWWQAYDLGAESGTYAGLEASALSVHNWEPSILPGLFQTADYAADIVRAFSDPWLNVDPAPYLNARAERQKRIFSSEGPEIWAIVDEAALRRMVGGVQIMRGQWQHLLELSTMSQVTLQYLSFDAGAHSGIQGPFVILEFAPDIVGDVVYSEGLAGQYFMEKPDELKRYRKAFDQLRALGESPERTRQFLRDRLAA